MPVRNGERYLAAAIGSVLGQSLRDLELIIIDDGSSDSTRQIAEAYAERDARIRVLTQSGQGLPRTRNRGIREASAPFVAWLDSDDLSFPSRLQTQLQFLMTHEDIDVCGSWVEVFGNLRDTWRFPVGDRAIKALLPFNSPLATSSVMIRRRALVDRGIGFDSDFENAEDYDLWARLADVTRMASLPQVLVRYRVHAAQNSRGREERMLENSGRVRRRLLAALGIEPSTEEFELHQRLSSYRFGSSLTELHLTERWLAKLARANQVKAFPEPEFSNVVRDRWYLACAGAAQVLGPRAWRTYRDSALSWTPHQVRAGKRVRLLAACLRPRARGQAANVT